MSPVYLWLSVTQATPALGQRFNTALTTMLCGETGVGLQD
jgi:hypothetical protein